MRIFRKESSLDTRSVAERKIDEEYDEMIVRTLGKDALEADRPASISWSWKDTFRGATFVGPSEPSFGAPLALTDPEHAGEPRLVDRALAAAYKEFPPN